MTGKGFSRRGLMQGAVALGTATLIPHGLSAQQVVRTASAQGAPLPGRGELLIRGVLFLARVAIRLVRVRHRVLRPSLA